MIRFIAEWSAKRWYVAKEYFSAATQELSAKAALKRAGETRDIIARTTKEADDIEARIKEVEGLQEKGYWECEGGHDIVADDFPRCQCGGTAGTAVVHISACSYQDGTVTQDSLPVGESTGLHCPQCDKAVKFIKRSTMNGQEQYESDKERKEAEKIVENKRAEIAQFEEQLKNQENTAKVLMTQANRNREFAELLRKL